jgi:hypothetical protein
LLKRIAATESVSLCTRGEKLTAFVELPPATQFREDKKNTAIHNS